MDKYLKTFKNILEDNSMYFNQNNVCIPPNEVCNEMIYYFDSIVSSVSVIIEPEQKEILLKYLNSDKIKNFYPTRQKFGLWWQIYMLRNRILHNTEARYDNARKYCSRYMDFSSKILMIRIKDNNIEIK